MSAQFPEVLHCDHKLPHAILEKNMNHMFSQIWGNSQYEQANNFKILLYPEPCYIEVWNKFVAGTSQAEGECETVNMHIRNKRQTGSFMYADAFLLVTFFVAMRNCNSENPV